MANRLNALQIQEKRMMSTIQLGVLVICETRAKVPPNSTNCINEMKSLAKIHLSVMVKCETLAERTATQEKHS